LASGCAVNGALMLVQTLAMARGHTRPPLSINLCALLIQLPAVYWGTAYWGLSGAAAVWPFLNLAGIVVGMERMPDRLPAPARRRWYWNDLGAPLAATLVTYAAFALFKPETGGRLTQLLWLLASYAAMSLAAVAAATEVRTTLYRSIRRSPVTQRSNQS
jgi:hypothetical protein